MNTGPSRALLTATILACSVFTARLHAQDLFVSDALGGTVWRIDVASGSPPVPFASANPYQPTGLAFGTNGDLFIADASASRVVRVDGKAGDTSGTGGTNFVRQYSSPLFYPQGMTFGPDGDLYVCSLLTGIIRYNGATGASQGFFAKYLPSQSGVGESVRFGPDANLYVASQDGTVYRYDGATGAPLGAFLRPPASWTGSMDFVFGPDDDLYVASTYQNSVLHYDGRTGELIGTLVQPYAAGLYEPWGLVFAPDGSLYVSSARDGRIIHYDGRTGAYLSDYHGGMKRPLYLAIRPAAVPEPGTLALLAGGLIALSSRRRRTLRG